MPMSLTDEVQLLIVVREAIIRKDAHVLSARLEVALAIVEDLRKAGWGVRRSKAQRRRARGASITKVV